LASQGGDPDYMITIWNWEKASVILRSKSFQNDILNVMFSPFVPGQLTTSGKFLNNSKLLNNLLIL